MKLRDKLEQILPPLLPTSAAEAIKGKELIARVRSVLGETYSDRSLLSQFSCMALDEASCLARIAGGQGYFLRGEETEHSLHDMFEDGAAQEEGENPVHKALAAAVRLYDTAGLGVFVYPVEEESWFHPDLVAVQWPAGHYGEDGAYIIDEQEAEPSYRAVCLAFAEDDESCRRAFYRALSCGLWAEEAELLLFGCGENEDLAELGARWGVGVRCIGTEEDELPELPRADDMFRAEPSSARRLLRALPQHILAVPRHRPAPTPRPAEAAAVLRWAEQCAARGRIEPFEMRVAAH
ncbi:MAG: hypothetical protein MR890_10025 [Akkermansia muciniphila]|nr:hypothetical protein [Akkermansia muciniphila]